MNSKNISNKKTAGFSLIEVMLSCLMFAIIMLGFIRYLTSIIHQHHYFHQHFKAQQMAFALLDSYPHTVDKIIPKEWQYQVYSQPYSAPCKMVFIDITPPNHKTIKQQRLLCD
ncbi:MULTISPECIES: type IV pilus modification PilV family protein [unclassified Gilliamella]|uniref:type IV pilus modification PilV family protein n=1 Tax=unclassified Gilliamella TaxID=2685620 RepID=UPI00226A181E|nr:MULTISPECIES: prepilin-type N-terminal cleavage/methylation domain-containing protein [unclassified Gilliamella]MCX8583624.1 prepilin-type N-terminal cleavage/methylation domain-containing protein [Gilliamella sp. B3372]MCX8594756.1 prepilin-type N-terminal cleavage/methylation domain-containing protein [Gilliamella sp. B3367]MCX8671762.1 prepilin-type N-terminal cleavage/methylation domain-containing protein [Gilliamella sp. B2785]MCX8675524.1 prepilin-type N-terminal cleavage/methylation d